MNPCPKHPHHDIRPGFSHIKPGCVVCHYEKYPRWAPWTPERVKQEDNRYRRNHPTEKEGTVGPWDAVPPYYAPWTHGPS
jgi:hypothetical protein